MVESGVHLAAHPVAARPRVSLVTLALAYLRIGMTAFGFTILQRLNALVLDRGCDDRLDTACAHYA